MKRSERVVAILKTLMDRPSSVLPLGHFASQLDAAKSTISEDVSLIRETLNRLKSGTLETIAGATGGVRYFPTRDVSVTGTLVNELCQALSKPDRVLPGEFVYMTDIVFSPVWASLIGEVFATRYREAGAQYVLTVETKGIPVALSTARCLGVPLVVCRRDAMATEGPAVSINYVSGSSRRIQTMSLPKRALSQGARVLVVDDFMKGGGTAKGMMELVAEFGAKTVGTAVLIEMAEPSKKLVSDYFSLAILQSVDDANRKIDIRPSPRIAS
jgi:purine operon repressor